VNIAINDISLKTRFDFGTNRKLIYDFLLVISTNLSPILHRFRDIAFNMSKIALFGYPLAFNHSDGGDPLGRSPQNFPWMSTDGQGIHVKTVNRSTLEKQEGHWQQSKRTKEVDSITGIFIRAEKTRAASICIKSAIIDHVCNENHVMDWENAKVVDRESDNAGRLIREAIWIRKIDIMNGDEGSQLPNEPRMGQGFTY